MSKNHILFITDAWGPQNGGINSFNYDLTIAMSKIVNSNCQIVCTCYDASKESIEEASSYGIKLLHLSSNLDTTEIVVVDILKEKLNITHIFCHDYISGKIGLELIEVVENLEDKLYSFHHMNPEAYDALKQNFNAVNTDTKRKLQLKLFELSNKIFCIGPKLRDSAIDKVGSKDKIVEIIPGLANTSSQNAPEGYFKAAIIGRISKDIDKVKQYDLALAACAKVDSMNHFSPDSVISLVGVSPEDTENVIISSKEILKKYNAKSLKLNPITYLTNRRDLFNIIKKQSIAFMLSAHEGFGLVGWEAIAAEVPLIISENTGLYQLLKERFGGFGIGNVLSVDIRSTIYAENSYSEEELTNVTNTLLRYLKNRDLYKKNAQILKNYLEISFTWENTAYDLAESCFIETIPKKFDLQRLSMPLLNILNIVKGINKRNIQYEMLVDFLNQNYFKKWLILFGGISSTLCENHLIETYSKWLNKNKNAKLFICFEDENALRYRLEKLNKDNLIDKQKSTIEINDKIKIKMEQLNTLKNTLNIKLKNKEQLTFINISTPLYFYSIIGDSEIIYTPLLDKRSSDTFSLHIDDSHVEIKRDIVNSIVNVLTKEGNIPKTLNETLLELNLKLK